ncbi:MAG: putative ABC transport system permease protein [Halieaceae bacterium]|jgi:putative ABC transport system permease protein
MFAYHFRMAWLSLRKTPVLSALIVSAIGLGIGVCISILTVYSLMNTDPAPAISHRLFTYKLHNQAALMDGQSADEATEMVGYRDALNLLSSDIPVRQSLHYQTAAVFYPAGAQQTPFSDEVRLATAGFFATHRVPFLYGSHWSASDEQRGVYQVVLTRELNEQLFEGRSSIGEELRIGEHIFKVVGVMDHFKPTPLYMELDGGSFREMSGAFIPFSLTSELGMNKKGGSTSCSGDPDGDDWQSFLEAECRWIHHWVELEDEGSVSAYTEFLDNYAMSQRQYNRFMGPFENEIHDVPGWLRDQQVVNEDYKILLGVAFLFLLVCLLNCIGLLLAKFLGKVGEMSLRRAVGGSRKMIFRQHLVEVSLIGLLGGAVGLALALAGLVGIRGLYRNYEQLTHLNIDLVLLAIVLAVGSTLLAGLYPAWRICRLPVSRYLKDQ